MSPDILAYGKYDVSETFGSVALEFYNITEEMTESQTEEFWLENMTEMMIDTRPTYPSSKLTFTIANITKDKAIRFFNIYLTLNGTFDVDVVLEDSKRNFLNSFILIFFFFINFL